MSAGPANLLTEWTRLLVGALRRAGLEDVVLSPGARSTPLVFALGAAKGLRVHVVRDERAAGFFALGLARATNRPAGLVCTSGTAPGHYLPAVMEARAAELPLLVLTADRPPELHGIAAPQTADQSRLYGEHAVGFVDLGAPDPHPAALRGLVRRAAQALFTARQERGAVQVDLRARKPLEPAAEGEGDPALTEAVDALLEGPGPRAFAPRRRPDPDGVAALAQALERAKRPLIVAGPRRPRPEDAEARRVDAAFSFAARLGAPLIAEAASQLRLRAAPAPVTRADGYDRLLLRPELRASLAPDLVVQLGRPPTSASLLRALSEWDAERWIVAERGWPDVDNRAQGILLGPLPETLQALEAQVSPAPARYAAKWRDAESLAWRPDPAAEWGEGAAVRAAVAATPAGAALMLGNSLPIRHVETHVRREEPYGLEVVVQRGVNGIDGLIAGAAGWVQGRGRGLTLVVGDVSFLHDATSLELARGLPAALVVVVLDNRGGRIFERLPVQKLGEAAMARFVTEPEADLEGIADAFGAAVRRAQDPHEVAAAVAKGHLRTGATFVRAIVPEHGAKADLDALVAGLGEALAAREEEA